MTEIFVLYDGYSFLKNEEYMIANCTCTLIKGNHNIIVDTMTPWDSEKILTALSKHNLGPDEINFVISTHGHSDHTGNNNLFLNAKHIVGFSVSFHEQYYLHPFDKGEDFIISDHVKVIPTPGHTLSDVTVLVTNDAGTTAVAGDLFERYEDIDDQNIWLDAGSEDSKVQKTNRVIVADLADWIIPGHGPKFQVDNVIRQKLRKQLNS